MEISIIIPTIRPNTIKKTIERIQATVKDIEYEIVITSPFQLEFPTNSRLKIIKEENVLTKHQAINQAVKVATGKYLFHIPDYLFLDTDCIKNLLVRMKQHDNELYLCSPRWHTLWEVIRDGWIWKDTYFASLPCIKRDNLSILGEFYNTSFTGWFGDIDLSLRVLKAGGGVEVCKNAFVEVFTPTEEENITHNEDIFWNKDEPTFKNIWGESSHIIPKEEISLPSNAYNLEVNKEFALPMEKCSRLFNLLKLNKLEELEEEINTNNYIVSKYLLLPFLYFVLLYYFVIPIPYNTTLLQWILKEISNTVPYLSKELRQDLINRFTVRPNNEVSAEDLTRLFGIYGTENIYNSNSEKLLKRTAEIVEFVYDQMAIVKPNTETLMNLVTKMKYAHH